MREERGKGREGGLMARRDEKIQREGEGERINGREEREREGEGGRIDSREG